MTETGTRTTSTSSDAPSEGGADLVLSGLTKRFPSFTAVDHLDLEVPSGSFFALLGPSGCGKTTTLRMVAGLETPTAGTIHLGGEDIAPLKPYKRPVNTVFQSYALFPHMTIAENVAFGLRRRGHKNVKGAVDEMLELVELQQYAGRRPAQLSGGQQQRVALARALINRPRMLLLDEPLGALDLKLRRQMQIELKQIQSEVGITFVHVTHDQEEAMTMADTVAVMNRGVIEQLGEPKALYERPQTTFVANFLGQSNLIRGALVERGTDRATVKVGDQTLFAPGGVDGSGAAGVEVGGDVWVGVRPEKVTLVGPADPQDSAQSGHNRLEAGVVVDASFLGVGTHYLVRMPDGNELTAYEQNVSGGDHFRAGDPVEVRWHPDHCFLLDAAQDAWAGVEKDDS